MRLKPAGASTGGDAGSASNGGASIRHPQSVDGATHFLMKTLPKVSTEMSLHVLAYNMLRVINMLGVSTLITQMMRA